MSPATDPRAVWLIERGQPEKQKPTVWLIEGESYGTDKWTTDANKATKYPTCEAAEALMAKQSGILARQQFVGRATEHIWMDRATDPPLTPDPFQDAWIASHNTGMHWGCDDPEHSACRVQQLIEAQSGAEAELLALRTALAPFRRAIEGWRDITLPDDAPLYYPDGTTVGDWRRLDRALSGQAATPEEGK